MLWSSFSFGKESAAENQGARENAQGGFCALDSEPHSLSAQFPWVLVHMNLDQSSLFFKKREREVGRKPLYKKRSCIMGKSLQNTLWGNEVGQQVPTAGECREVKHSVGKAFIYLFIFVKINSHIHLLLRSL